jgi:CheY-like chemotaxis protein
VSGHVEGTCASCHEHFAAELSEVRVCDDGPGIPAESLPRIFEPFYSTRGGQGGSGLGLSVVHGLVHGWGGHILVERDAGMTRFRVLLPAAPAPAVEVSPRLSLPAVAGPLGRLLLVDDEPLVGQSMARVLRRKGWAVTFEGDGASALARAAQEAFDVVLTDYAMPGMNGLELARALKESGFSAPILLMTGNPGDVPASTDIVMVLAKPPDLDELAVLLAAHAASRP